MEHRHSVVAGRRRRSNSEVGEPLLSEDIGAVVSYLLGLSLVLMEKKRSCMMRNGKC